MDVIERASRYLAKMEASFSGDGGHNACFAAACAMVKGFDLPEAVAFDLLMREFNPRCSELWSEREMWHKVNQAKGSSSEVGYLLGNDKRGVSGDDVRRWRAGGEARRGAEVEKVKKGQEIDMGAVKMATSRDVVDEDFIRSRSPLELELIRRPEDFLGALYDDGEKVLIFTSERSQGDFGFFVDGGMGFPGRGYRLGQRPKARAVAEDLPRSGRLGVWFLANPVDGQWRPNGSCNDRGEPVMSRRSGGNVTAWRYLLLESDDLDAGTWMNLVVHLPLPISAIYTSGSRSVHVLVRVDAATQDELRLASEVVGPVMAKLGGDWKAMSSVRLTRLPLCVREGRMAAGENGGRVYKKFPEPMMQELLFCDPDPDGVPIAAKPRR